MSTEPEGKKDRLAKAEEAAPAAVDTKAVEGDARFNFGPALIQTAEDATQAYLRGDITEDELRAALAKFGVAPGSIPRVQNAERVDAAFQNQLPDDLYEPVPAEDTVENRMKAANEKQAAREAATAEAEKTEAEAVS